MKQQAERSLDQVWVNWREQQILEKMVAKCQLAGGSLLDVPCGYGRFMPLLTRLGVRAIGVDLDPALVRLVVQIHVPDSRGRAVCASIFELPFTGNSFDGVLCVRLLHLRYSDAERLQILRELARVSCRFVLISFYRFTALHGLARRWHGTPGRLRMMTLTQLRDLAGASGLQLHSLFPLLPYCHMQTFAVFTKSVNAEVAGA